MKHVFLQVDQITTQTQEIITQGNLWVTKLKDMAIEYASKIVGAIIIYLIGSFIIRKISNAARLVFNKRNFDLSLSKFLVSLISVSLSILMFLAIAGMLGVDITSFAALLAGAGLAIGAALNGSLGNFAGGVMVMIFKPFKVGDIIEAQGQVGVVSEVGIFNTVLLSPENKTVILPNGPLSTGTIVNFNSHGNLRVDLTMAIAPDEDIDKARWVAINAMKKHPKVLETPTREVSVMKIGDGMITLAIRPHTTQADYWDVYFGTQELVKKAFDLEGVRGPIPTRVVINK